MKILILSQWYPPEPQEFLSELAETLKQFGNEVIILTGFPNWPTGRLYPGYRLKIRQREVMNGISVIRVPLYPDHSHSSVKRILNFLSFVTSLTFLGPWLCPSVDIIHVIHPPLTMGWAACVLSKFKKVPFTYEIQDMWPETLRATGMLNNEWALDLIGQFGKWVYSKASAIRVISPGFRDNLIQKGVDAGKIHVISNWVDTNFFRPLEPDSSVATQYGLENRFNILYAGTIGFAQGLETVINAAELLRDVPKIQFVLVGDGADFQRLKKLTEKKALKNVKFLGRHPVDQMPVFYALADVLFLHLKDDPLFRITIPHKIFTYLASGRPILAAVHGDAAQVVGESDSGVICPPDNAPALADAVRKLYQLPAEERIEMGINARRAAIEQYSREILISRINHMIAEIVHSKNRH